MTDHMGKKGRTGELLGHHHTYYAKYSQLGQHQGVRLMSCKITSYLCIHPWTCSVKEGSNAVFICYAEEQKMFSEITAALKLQEMCATAILEHLLHM